MFFTGWWWQFGGFCNQEAGKFDNITTCLLGQPPFWIPKRPVDIAVPYLPWRNPFIPWFGFFQPVDLATGKPKFVPPFFFQSWTLTPLSKVTSCPWNFGSNTSCLGAHVGGSISQRSTRSHIPCGLVPVLMTFGQMVWIIIILSLYIYITISYLSIIIFIYTTIYSTCFIRVNLY